MKYLKIFTDFLQDMEPLSDDERGRLFSAMLRYAEDQTETDLTGNERFLWGTAKRHIDTEREYLQRKHEAGSLGGLAKASAIKQILACASTGKQTQAKASQKDKDKEKDNKEILSNESIKKFTVPTVEEVRAYISEHGYSVDAERFVNFYESKGWMVGKSKMKDWQAAVRNWAKDSPKKSQYTNAELERLEVDLTKKRDHTYLPDSWMGIK